MRRCLSLRIKDQTMRRLTNERALKRGSTLITTILLVGALSVVLAAILRSSIGERKINHRHMLRTQADNTAEAVVEYGFAQLSHTFDNATVVASNTFASSGAGALSKPPVGRLRSNIKYSDVALFASAVPSSSLVYIDPAEPDNLFDPLKGKYVRAFEVNLYGKATVTDPNGGPDITSYIGQRFQVRDSPLFSHAIFYNLDLDIHPGPDMDISGPVHSNEDIRLAPYNYLKFHDTVSTAGHVLHQYEHKSTSRTGHVYIPDDTDTLQTMYVDSVWKDSKMGTGSISDDFRSYASNRWKGNLQTEAHGISHYKPVAFADYEPDDTSTPAYDPVNSGRAIIEPPLPSSHSDYNTEIEDQKMSNKAGLYFKWDTTTGTGDPSTNPIDLKAYDGDGNLLDISDLDQDGGGLWELTDGTLYDRRRGDYIPTINIHMGKLKQLIESPNTGDVEQHIGGYDPATDWNGVVYFQAYSTDSDATAASELNMTGIRLIGGDTDETGEGIPSRGTDPGMTFATNNALYIQGNFNADGVSSSASSYEPETGEVPVAIMGDSITFLSRNWTDAHGDTLEPDAATTEVSAAAVSGIRPPDKQGDDTYSGGAHNFPRFLESWTSDTFYLRGSMVCLYECEVDDSTWSTSYYNPPNRGYGFNNLFKDGTYPPGTPLLRTYRRDNFQDLNASEFNTLTSGL